jgi:molybdate transport system ATP-binding protein
MAADGRANGGHALEATIRLSRSLRTGTSFDLDVAFRAEAGVTILFGPSGAGKSTLLDCLAGLQRPAPARIVLGDRVLQDSQKGIFLPPQQRHIAYLFQAPSLFPNMSVFENAAFGLAALSVQRQSEAVNRLLDAFRITHLADRKPSQISGGEAQRAALARALAPDPAAVLLDEPLSGLDAELKAAILNDLRAWNAVRRVPILYVTHQRDEVDALGEKIIAMDSGKIVDLGLPHAVLDAPRTRRLAQAAGFENLLTGTVTELGEADGVMRVQLHTSRTGLEVPLGYASTGDVVKIAIRAGDILMATQRPAGLSARNLLEGEIKSVELRGATVVCVVIAGEEFVVHVTPGASRSLALGPGQKVWLVIKTHSCHLVAE